MSGSASSISRRAGNPAARRLAPFIVLVGLASVAQAQTTVYVGDSETALSVARHDGAAYLSLTRLLEAVGGSCTLRAGRAEAVYGGRSAFLALNGTRVDAAAMQFSLTHPVLRDGEEALLAVEDVAPFFASAFAETARVAGQGATSSDLPPPGAEAERTLEPAESMEPASELADLTDPIAPVRRTRRTIGVIVLDPGHGGSDSGQVGYEGAQEKAITLAVALRLEALLEERHDVAVLLTRSEDIDLPGRARPAFAAKNGGDLFISLHCGASYTREARGVEAFYHEPGGLAGSGNRAGGDRNTRFATDSRALAETLVETLAADLRTESRGSTGAPVRGLGRAPMPAALIELGCLTNRAEEALLATQTYHERLAESLAGAIADYARLENRETPDE